MILFDAARNEVLNISKSEISSQLEPNRKRTPSEKSYYLSIFVSKNKKQIDVLKEDPLITSSFINKMSKLNADENKLYFIELQTKSHGKKHIIYMCSPLYDRDQKLGYLWVVKDLSYFHEQLEKWFFLLFIVSALSSFASFLLANHLSKRAIEPIKRNYEKQREFVSNASHELRAPLSVFTTSLEVLEQEMDNCSSFTKQIILDLKDEGRQMNQLVDHLLTLAKTDQGKIKLHHVDFSLKEFIQSILEQYQRKEHERFFHLDMVDEPMLVMTDPSYLKQILYILLDNACKYTEHQGQILLKAWARNEKDVAISVSDNGIGIPEADQPFIFDRFYRVEKGRSRKFGGSGLGLSIAKEFILDQNGTIEVKSKPGEGSTFIITLPILPS